MASFDDSGAPHDGASSSAPRDSTSPYAYPFSVAPMMGVTDRHWRWMARQMSRKTLLYTEMVVDNALNHNAHNLGGTQFLGHDACEAPVAVQLGGNDAKALGDAAARCVDYFGDSCVEINLNCGCPSNVVAARNEFGARLMLDPEKVRGIVHELIRRCPSTPVTVKHRLGTDLSGSDYATTLEFVRASRAAGCRHFVLHAREAVLDKKFSTQQNRTIPPLKPDVAHMLARDLPDCTFAMNGMLRSLEDCAAHLSEWKGLPPVHSTMVGRAAWYQPWDLLATADTALYGAASDPAASRREVLEAYLDYADERYAALDVAEDCLYRPLFYLFGGEQNSKKFRVRLADEVTRRARRTNRGRDAAAAAELPPPSDVVRDALAAGDLSAAAMDRRPGESAEPQGRPRRVDEPD